MSPTYAKGQISAEYLFLFAIFIAVLTISLSTLQSLREKSAVMLEDKIKEISAQKLIYAAEEVCITGSGNKRIVEVKKEVEIKDNKIEGIEPTTPCELEEGKVVGRVVVENKKGKILFT